MSLVVVRTRKADFRGGVALLLVVVTSRRGQVNRLPGSRES